MDNIKTMFLGMIAGIVITTLITAILLGSNKNYETTTDPARACFECGKPMKADEFDLINNVYIYKCKRCGFTLITDIPMGSDN